MLTACSTKQNTAASRRWQAFVTRYNVYYNASEAYKAGEEAQRSGLQEDYTERLPIFSVGYPKMRSLGKSNFETAIAKCEKAIQLHSIKVKPKRNNNQRPSPQQRAYLSRKEFNPFLKNAWLLMGRAQFQQGDFVAAASTFAYITRFYAAEPEVVAEARIWLARAYAELEWFYDAEDALQRIAGDTLSRRLSRERDLTMSDFLIRQERLEEALPYLQRAAARERNSSRKARLFYLLAQVCMQLERKTEAYRALQKCIAQNHSTEMTFHARILQTEALTTPASAEKMLARLKRMARNEGNKDYLEQVYYAMGNIHLSRRDTLAAIEAYETGRFSAAKATPEKGVLLIRLANLYWEQSRFDKAQPCYTEAIGLLDKSRSDYAELTRRSKILDELVPHTATIFEQDSLLALARMSETDRNAVIDRAIADYERREEAARKARADSARRAAPENGDFDMDNGLSSAPSAPLMRPATDRAWYFYNSLLVQQGKQSFARQWGRRRNEDDWQRSNRTMLAAADESAFDYAAEDSVQALLTAHRDSLAATGMSQTDIEAQMAAYSARLSGTAEHPSTAPKPDADQPAGNPRKREYYLAKIPFSPEAQAEAHRLLQDALFNAGVLEKDRLGDIRLAEKTLRRLVRNYPSYDKLNEAYYHLFLIAKRQGRETDAAHYRTTLATYYPHYSMTKVVNDPDFERNSRYARELEDSLYAATYNAYRAGDGATVAANFARASSLFPTGANRPKFILVHALARLATAPRDTLSAELRALATDYPKSDVAEMASMIVRGLESGRTVAASGFDMGSLWARRLAEASAETAAEGKERKFTAEQDVPFVFLVAYPSDSLDDDRLLYALARFNFTTVSRGLDIAKERDKHLTQFRVSGFVSYKDVHRYAQLAFRDGDLASLLRSARVELISEFNLKLLGTLYSFDDYRKFYERNFAPLDINPDLPLEYEPTEGQPKQIYEDELPASSAPAPGAKTSDEKDDEKTATPYEEFDMD